MDGDHSLGEVTLGGTRIGIHRYSPTSTRSSWLMSRWAISPVAGRGVWQTCWEALQSFWMVAGGTHSCPEGRCSTGTKASRHKLCKVTILLSNKQMVLRTTSMPALHWVPYKYLGISSSVSDVRASIRVKEPPSCQLEQHAQHGSCKFYLEQSETLIWRQHFRQLLSNCSKR